tara:strand:+ start:401 stop:1072 length:672 start_codon:yes stop_codon:yes gene_type:complete
MFDFANWILSGALLSTAIPALDTAQQASQVAPAAIETQAEPALSQTEAIAKANAALNAIDTAKGKFTQLDANGNFSQGEFYLNRPGRMRFEYADPMPLLIVSDGTTVAFEDKDLETVERVPLSATPLNLILRRTADLAADADIISAEKKAGFIAIKMADKSDEAEGELELFFDPVSFQLMQWETTDITGAVTTVQLSDVELGASVSPRLFRLEDPEDEDERRR